MERIYGWLSQAKSIEDISCLSTLIATKALKPDAKLSDAHNYFMETLEDCGNCPHSKVCLAMIINE